MENKKALLLQLLWLLRTYICFLTENMGEGQASFIRGLSWYVLVILCSIKFEMPRLESFLLTLVMIL